MRTLAGLLLALLLAPLAAPALASHEGHRHWSTVPDGPYAALPGVERAFVASDGTRIAYGVHMPDVPPGTRVPIILTAGPYFGVSEEPVDVPSTRRLSGFLVDNFVSHGYAVVAANVRGTGRSGGCMELMSLREAQDLDELVTFLASEPWSTGAVGMIGKSYDGSTPWMVAQFGNPNLKTIVPLQGVTDQGDLLFHQGAAQSRAPIFHAVVYWPFGFDRTGYRAPEDVAANAVCPEVAEGQAAALVATYTGDTRATPVASAYWEERAFRERVLENYDGSVFIVHSLRDFNVLPSQVVPFFGELEVEKKLLMGQWAHEYPDEGVLTQRDDFARMLKAWFDRHLKGLDVDTGPVAEVADGATGSWRALPTWPVANETRAWNLSAPTSLTTGPAAPFAKPIVTPAGAAVQGRACGAGAGPTTFSTPLASSFRYSGIGQVDVTLDPPTPGVLVAAVCVNGRQIAFGAASTTAPRNELAPFAPDAPRTFTIDLEPVERTVPAGTRLSVSIHFEDALSGESDMGYHPATSPGVGVLVGGALRLPVDN